MRKTAWLAIGLILVISLSGCGGRRPSETDQPKTSAQPTVEDIDQLIDSLNELGDLVDSLDPVDESSLIIPEA